MITKFDSSYAGHIDMEDLGYGGTPVNDRFYPNDKLVTTLYASRGDGEADGSCRLQRLWMA